MPGKPQIQRLGETNSGQEHQWAGEKVTEAENSQQSQKQRTPPLRKQGDSVGNRRKKLGQWSSVEIQARPASSGACGLRPVAADGAAGSVPAAPWPGGHVTRPERRNYL